MVTLNKFHKDKFFTKIQHASSASGVIGLPEYEVFGENILRVVTDFTSSGILTLEARIKHSETWENLGTLLADGDSEEFNIGSYDYIRFNFTTPSGSSGQVGVSGFFKGSASSASGAGFNIIQPDAGTAPVSDSTNSILNITSSDGSILVGGDSVTDTINLTISSSLIDYFESVSKNIKSWNYALNYTGSTLTSIVYTQSTNTITKTLNYTGDKLTSIVLSGDTPSAIDLTKTLTYTGDQLTAVAYS
jgi:hypothetical protein